MNLIIDIGNTAIKLALFKGGELLFDERIDHKLLIEKIEELFSNYSNINQALVSSTGELDKKAMRRLSALCELHILDSTVKVPFKNLYETPLTLGVDRIALAAAAYDRNASGNTLIIDAGTCITYDIVTHKNEYLGGAISPGINMRYEAMHNQTSKLPLLEKEIPVKLIGNSTETSMHSGVVFGTCEEIDGVINLYKTRFADLTVILTGGDAHFLSERLKNTIFADSKFLLKGLNYLLEYNKL